MLGSEEIIRVVAKAVKNSSIPVVVDPVLDIFVETLMLGDGVYVWVNTASSSCNEGLFNGIITPYNIIDS
jgi:hypothetical protein